MSYTKGVWEVGRGAYCVVSTETVPEVNGSEAVEYYGGHLIGESMSEANAKRIVDCVNACEGMEKPSDEISKLRGERDAAMDELNRLADAFRFFIEDGERPSEFILAEWEFKAKKACS